MESEFVYEVRLVCHHTSAYGLTPYEHAIFTSLEKAREAVRRVMTQKQLEVKYEKPILNGYNVRIFRRRLNPSLIDFRQTVNMTIFDITHRQEILLDLLHSHPDFSKVHHFTMLVDISNEEVSETKPIVVEILGNDIAGIVLSYLLIPMDRDTITRDFGELATRGLVEELLFTEAGKLKRKYCKMSD